MNNINNNCISSFCDHFMQGVMDSENAEEILRLAAEERSGHPVDAKTREIAQKSWGSFSEIFGGEVDFDSVQLKEYESVLDAVLHHKRAAFTDDQVFHAIRDLAFPSLSEPHAHRKEDVKEPEVEQKEPEVKQKEPEIEQKEPEIEQKEPEIEQKEPEIEQKEPEVKQKEREAIQTKGKEKAVESVDVQWALQTAKWKLRSIQEDPKLYEEDPNLYGGDLTSSGLGKNDSLGATNKIKKYYNIAILSTIIKTKHTINHPSFDFSTQKELSKSDGDIRQIFCDMYEIYSLLSGEPFIHIKEARQSFIKELKKNLSDYINQQPQLSENQKEELIEGIEISNNLYNSIKESGDIEEVIEENLQVNDSLKNLIKEQGIFQTLCQIVQTQYDKTEKLIKLSPEYPISEASKKYSTQSKEIMESIDGNQKKEISVNLGKIKETLKKLKEEGKTAQFENLAQFMLTCYEDMKNPACPTWIHHVINQILDVSRVLNFQLAPEETPIEDFLADLTRLYLTSIVGEHMDGGESREWAITLYNHLNNILKDNNQPPIFPSMKSNGATVPSLQKRRPTLKEVNGKMVKEMEVVKTHGEVLQEILTQWMDPAGLSYFIGHIPFFQTLMQKNAEIQALLTKREDLVAEIPFSEEELARINAELEEKLEVLAKEALITAGIIKPIESEKQVEALLLN